MNKYRIKIFQHYNHEELQNQINEWFNLNPKIKLGSQQMTTVNDPDGRGQWHTLTILYKY